MNINPHISYEAKQQVWRILISGSDKVIIEKRDTGNKEVFFDCFELIDNEKIFTDFQLDEKFWTGIERIYKDVIFFHKYPKPDMPGHKEILAFDIGSQNILWTNEEYAYLFIYNDKVHVFKQQFEGRRFYTLDYKSGELIDDLGSDADKINKLYDKAREEEDYSEYNFPGKEFNADDKISGLIEKFKSPIAIVGEVEYNIYDDTLFLSYHVKTSEKEMAHKFSAIDTSTEHEIFNTILCSDTDKFMTDSFFIYKNYLFLLKEKNEIDILVLDNNK